MKYTVRPCEFNYSTNKQIIEDLIKEYPFLNVRLIGRTSVGRSIFSLSLGSNKNNVIYVGSVRGSDGLTGLILLLFIERLCQSIKFKHTVASVDIRRALSLSGITVIPCLNPDGREIYLKGEKGAGNMGSFVSSFYKKEKPEWNSNALGVDINRNFLFSVIREEAAAAPSPSLYRGEYPESEAETKSLTRLCRIINFRQCLELSIGDNDIFFKSKEGEPASSQMMAKILSSSCSFPVNSENDILSPGIMDWFIKEFHRPAFRLGIKGVEQQLYSIYSQLEEALTVFSLL